MDVDLAHRLEALALERFGPSTVVERVAPLAGDASTRRYARLTLAGTGVPATVVAMILADRGIAMSSDELAVFEQAPQELPYLNVHRFLSALAVPVPEVLYDASERGFLLLEDIGDTALWDAVQGLSREQVLRWYERAIDCLLTIQIAGSRRADRSCLAFQQAFDERLFRWELEHFIEYGIEKRLAIVLPDSDAKLMQTAFAAIASDLGSARRFLNHRDYHSWNLYVQGDAIRVIDFQDALLAPAPYDLATLLGDRDTPQLITPDVERSLLQYYIAQWQRRGGDAIDPAEIERQYFACAFQKALKVVGRFYYLHMVKNKPGYLRYIPSTVRQVRRLLPRFASFDGLAEVIERYLPAEEAAAR